MHQLHSAALVWPLCAQWRRPAPPPSDDQLAGCRQTAPCVRSRRPSRQLPYDYYRLNFCKPAELKNSVENLGEVLHGSMIQNSAYELYMQKSDFKVLCKVTLNKQEAATFGRRIKQDYRVQMIMDNLPAVRALLSLRLCRDCACHRLLLRVCLPPLPPPAAAAAADVLAAATDRHVRSVRALAAPLASHPAWHPACRPPE